MTAFIKSDPRVAFLSLRNSEDTANGKAAIRLALKERMSGAQGQKAREGFRRWLESGGREHLAHIQALPLAASGTWFITSGVKTASIHQHRSGLLPQALEIDFLERAHFKPGLLSAGK